MRRFLIVAAAGLVAAVAVVAVVVAVQASGQLSRLNAQVSQLTAQVRQSGGQLSAARASLSGAHRDLITCGDLQSLLNGDPNNSLNADMQTLYHYAMGSQSVGLPLPAHCVNQ